MPDAHDQWTQAKIAYQVYVKGSTDWAWNPAKKVWVWVGAATPPAPSPGDDALSPRVVQRIAAIKATVSNGDISGPPVSRRSLESCVRRYDSPNDTSALDSFAERSANKSFDRIRPTARVSR